MYELNGKNKVRKRKEMLIMNPWNEQRKGRREKQVIGNLIMISWFR